MRLLLGLLLLYALFLVQVLLAPVGPDLVVLGVLALALHESRARATLFGLAGGLMLDTASPGSFGAACLVLSGSAWLTALLHSVAARSRWYILVLSLLVVGIRLLVGWLAGAGLSAPVAGIVSAALTVTLAVPAELLVGRLLYRR